MVLLNRIPQFLADISKRHVLVVGDVMLDEYIWNKPNRISPEAPVQVFDFLSSQMKLGGAANVALNLKAIGLEVTLMGVVGEDEAASRLRGLLDEAGIKHFLTSNPERVTTLKTRIMANRQQVARIDREK